jgi:transposase
MTTGNPDVNLGFMSPEVEHLFSENTMLKTEVCSLNTLIARSAERETRYQGEIEWLKEKIITLNRDRFGPHKERWESDEQCILLFNEAEIEAQKPEEAEAQVEVTVGGFKRKRGKRKALPDHLPREIVTVELPENERFSEDGQPLKVIGKEISEKFVFEPAQMKVVEYHRCRYGLDSGDPVKTAPPVPMIIPKGIVTPSLLADIVVKKYADGLPLYRQEEIWKRHDIEMSRSSMGRWVIKGAEACLPVWNALEEMVLTSSYVSCDETRTQVLKEKDRKAESQSWMWVRATPSSKNPIVLFDYDPSRSGDVAKKLLADYKGFLQADGYSGYNPVEKQEGVNRIGCNMHGRRGFYDANEGAKSGRGLAARALKYYHVLYDIEEKARESGLSWDDRKKVRDEKAVPIWDEMKLWAEKHVKEVPAKSKIGQALNYFIGQYDLLRGYLQHGCLEIDNGFAERAIRKFAIGRNNWLFSDTPEGAHASALFYSFVVTAKINGVNPYKALKTIFERIPTASTADDYEALAKLLLFPEKSA